MNELYLWSLVREHLEPGEDVDWKESQPENPGHYYGMVTFDHQEINAQGGDAALHILEPGAHNSAAWVARDETILRVYAVAGFGAVTVMNLFSDDKKVYSSFFEIDEKTLEPINDSSEPITLGRGDIHCWTNLGSRPLIVRDAGYPAFEPGDEKSLCFGPDIKDVSDIALSGLIENRYPSN